MGLGPCDRVGEQGRTVFCIVKRLLFEHRRLLQPHGKVVTGGLIPTVDRLYPDVYRQEVMDVYKGKEENSFDHLVRSVISNINDWVKER